MRSRAIAYYISAEDLPRLCDAAEERAPGEPGDRYEDVLREATLRRSDFGYPGACVVVALSFLDEAGVDIYAAHQSKAERLTARREASHTILTRGLARLVFAGLRKAPIDVRALVRYDADLRGATTPGDAEPLKAAVRFVLDVLGSVRDGEKAVVVIRLVEPAAAPACASPPHASPAVRGRNLRPAW